MNIKATRAHFATGIGTLALISWSSVASLVMFVGELPIFEKQLILFSFSFLLAICKFKFTLIDLLKKMPIKLLLAGIIGIYLNNLLFIAAFSNAPAEKVDLINYLWPLLIVLFSVFLPKEKLKINQIIGAFVAFYGVYCLITNGQGLSGFEMQYWKGYLYAFLDAICWTYFTLTIRKYKHFSVAQIGIYCGMAAFLSLISHLAVEKFVMPNTSQWCCLALIGITSQGAAYYFWNYGVKNGDYKQLCVLSYFNPIISVGLLVLCGFAQFTMQLFTASILVSIGAIVACNKFGEVSKKLFDSIVVYNLEELLQRDK